MQPDLITIITLILPVLLFSLVVHEMAHAVAADKLGDPTARMLGRVSLNPIVHLDPFMSVLLPAILIFSGSPVIFGGAKPVPVNFRYLKNPRRDMALIALAGPISNIIIAALCFFTLKILLVLGNVDFSFAKDFLIFTLQMNVVLAIFNMFPVPPLDGSRVLAAILPGDTARILDSLEKYGLILIFLLIFTGLPSKAIYGVLQFVQQLLLV